MQGLAGPAVYAEKARGQLTLVMSAYPILTSFPLEPSGVPSYEQNSVPTCGVPVKHFLEMRLANRETRYRSAVAVPGWTRSARTSSRCGSVSQSPVPASAHPAMTFPARAHSMGLHPWSKP